MKVLVIPEDPTLDQHILKPVVQRIFRDLQQTARVAVLQDPHLGGVSEALDRHVLADILGRYPMIDLFLLVVDRDCNPNRHAVLDVRRQEALALDKTLLTTLAIEEVETWALALHHRELDTRWLDVRAHCHPKERYFDPFVRANRWQESLGRGRVAAMRALPGNWASLKQLCTEIEQLQGDIRTWLANR